MLLRALRRDRRGASAASAAEVPGEGAAREQLEQVDPAEPIDQAEQIEEAGDQGGAPEPDPACRRRFGRVRVGDTRCSLGRVTNISAGGMRVMNRSMTQLRAGAQVVIRVEAGSEEWLEARVCVAWVRPAGVFRQEMGLEFVAIDEDARRALLEMAHSAGCAGGFRLMAESERHD